MIQKLYIQNYALIDELSVNFGAHLNIITGETGAGKSILLGALGLILGDRADAAVLSDKAKKCVVEAQFQIDKKKYISFFEENELDFDTLIYIRREITPQGKSRAFINDTPVNLSVLRALTSQLVDLHLQNETQELNGPAFHLNVVDYMADTVATLQTYHEKYKLLKSTEANLNQLKAQQQQALLEKDYKTFLLDELNQAKLDEINPTAIEQEAETLEHAEKIMEQASQALTALSEGDDNIIDRLSQLKSIYLLAGKHYIYFKELAARIESTIIELKDISSETESEAGKISPDPKRLSDLNSRLKEIYQLMQKHRTQNMDELLEIRNKLEVEVSSMLSLEDSIDKAEKAFEKLNIEVASIAEKLSKKRISFFSEVENGINHLLPEAGLLKSKIKIDHRIKPLSADGIDDLQFLFSANTGSEFVPLHKTASGGELSRFMLSIKTYIAGKTDLPTLVFDEIDTGVSGEIALKMGNLMKTLSKKHQLITVTHLPQIAGKADNHFKLYKQEIDGKTYSRIKELKDEEKVNELAEMLGGSTYGEKTLQAAAELLQK